MQVYKGYNILDRDMRMPDFTNCTTERSTAGAGRQCHSKSVVRPLTVRAHLQSNKKALDIAMHGVHARNLCTVEHEVLQTGQPRLF